MSWAEMHTLVQGMQVSLHVPACQLSVCIFHKHNMQRYRITSCIALLTWHKTVPGNCSPLLFYVANSWQLCLKVSGLDFNCGPKINAGSRRFQPNPGGLSGRWVLTSLDLVPPGSFEGGEDPLTERRPPWPPAAYLLSTHLFYL